MSDSTKPTTQKKDVGIHSKSRKERIEKIEYITNIMDSRYTVPYLKTKIGFDSILGLFPTVGDSISACFSVFILYQAYRLDVPPSTLVRMSTNIGIDFILGMIPVIGTVGDWAWKANEKNADLAKSRIKDRTKTTTDIKYLLRYVVPAAIVVAFSVIALLILIVSLMYESTTESILLRELLR